MKIFKIEIENFRLLKNLVIDLENELSLIIGKNNTGKTSILLALEKFLNSPSKFTFDDFNIEFKQELKRIIEAENNIAENDYKDYGIKLKLFINYDEEDDLSNISSVMMDLNPENNVIVLGFEYSLNYINYGKIRNEYIDFQKKEKKKKSENEKYQEKNTFEFIKQNLHYFKPRKYSFDYDKSSGKEIEANFIDLESEKISIKEIVNFKYISARRDVSNKDPDKTLSSQTSRIYEISESSEEQNKAIDDFKDALGGTDSDLSKIYTKLFYEIVDKVKIFGGVKENESAIEIISTLQHRELLKGNTTVVYSHDKDNKLPEYYNGLGYMNLISMIFEIYIKIQEFKGEKDKKPSDINLFFIEEPEAHTHPQMQYVFIKNIKNLLNEGIKGEDGANRPLQYLISTHSSHIVADSDFNDIKYLKKEINNKVVAKNLKDLKKEYDQDSSQYQFLKQYLTISRAEIFFADKTILIEGDTERILLSTMMRKIDKEEKLKYETNSEIDKNLPLLSQNISIVEVGAYSQIFEKFIDFLGIKSLIITDIDTVDVNGKSCKFNDGVNYSNSALSYFFNNPTLASLKEYKFENKLLNKVNGKWISDSKGILCIVYQTKENKYNARSFEDAFININKVFIISQIDSFEGLKNKTLFTEKTKDAYDLADECVKKKTHFALDIIYNSNEELSNWQIPDYIKEGLLWLKAD